MSVFAQLFTKKENTWCRWCGNFGIMSAFASAIENLIGSNKATLESFVMVTGIGCHNKIADYFNLNSLIGLHGRAISVSEGIKLANKNLNVIAFVGDGDTYAEGIEHLIFAAKRNINITVIVHNNRDYALTTGQYTPTSPEGYRGKTTPFGNKEKPLNPLAIMFEAGATFIARAYSAYTDHLRDLMIEAILHKGFSIIDVLQPCVSFYNTYNFYNERVYKLLDHDPFSKERAYEKIKEWDYNSENTKIPVGILYKENRQTFEELI